MPQIMERAKVDQTFYNHLNKLTKDGKVLKSEQGYRQP